MTPRDQENATGQDVSRLPSGRPGFRLTERPWLPAVMACAVALLILLTLLIPGVLIHPVAAPAVPIIADETQRQSNAALEERVGGLRRLLERKVCVGEGGYQFAPSVPGAGQAPELTPEERAILPPPPLQQTPAPPSPDGAPAASSTLLERLDQATVLVLQSDAAGALQGTGTGFLVAPGRIVTNRHVVGAPGSRIHIASQTFGVLEARVVASTNTETPGSPDFALLSVDSAAGQPFQLSIGVQRLLNVVAVGFPGLIVSSDDRFRRLITQESSEYPEASVTDGVVTALQSGSGANIVLHTAQITPGNSGGPLIDRCGRVVAINTFIQTRQEGRMNYALAAADIIRFLAEHNVQVAPAADACPAGVGGTR